MLLEKMPQNWGSIKKVLFTPGFVRPTTATQAAAATGQAIPE